MPEVTYADLYERVVDLEHAQQIQTLITNGTVQVVAIHSGEVFDGLMSNLDAVAKAHLHQLVLLAPGQRVAHKIQQQGLDKLIVADSAVANNMVEALVRWYTDSHR